MHRLACGDAMDPAVVAQLVEGDTSARLVLTDEPYNIPIVDNVTRRPNRELQSLRAK
jgi:hypothetical protein